jgi:uncharacterized protein YxjI
LLTFSDEFWIRDRAGARTYHVDGKVLRFRDAFVLEDAAGRVVAAIQERRLTIRDVIAIERDGREIARVRKEIVGPRLAVEVAGSAPMTAHGDPSRHRYALDRGDRTVIRVSRRRLRPRDTYLVEVARGEDEALALVLAVAIDALIRW